MKTVTINDNWIKISDIIEKDSAILVSSGPEINLTCNINNDPIKFSTYKTMENFTVKKNSSLWIRANNSSCVLNIFNIQTGSTDSKEQTPDSPSNETIYQNIQKIESTIDYIEDRIKSLERPVDKYSIYYSLDLDVSKKNTELLNNITNAFSFVRNGYPVKVINLNGFSFFKILPVTMINIEPVLTNDRHYLKITLSFIHSPISHAVTYIPVTNNWQIDNEKIDFYSVSNWNFYGFEEVLSNNNGISKSLVPNPSMNTQSFTLQELRLNSNENIDRFKEIHIFYSINDTYCGGKFVIAKNSDINSQYPQDFCTFTNIQKQTGCILFYGKFPKLKTDILLKTRLVYPTPLTGDTAFSIKKVIGKYH